MSVNYDLYETPDLTKSGEEQPLHARVVLKGSYTAEEFVEQVTAFQHMPHAQVVGVIEAISKELRHLLLKGFSVELGDIGYFRFSSVRLNRLRNKLLANYLKSGGNELATVRISAFCVAMLSNNSFICKYSIFFRKYELSAAVL